ncbi:MAG: hypothetical protein HAW67_01320, partial [Endozoicomonadaceae bacterium]|nr:hypothetical protein [Endozoicomonadaceae bacterium]
SVIESLHEDVTKKQDALKVFKEKLNKAVAELVQNFTDDSGQSFEVITEEFENLKTDLDGCIGDVVTEIEQYQCERSDKWQESEAGEQTQTWLDTWKEYHNCVAMLKGEDAPALAALETEESEWEEDEEFELPPQYRNSVD